MSAIVHVKHPGAARADLIARRRAASVKGAARRREINDARKIEQAGAALAAPPCPKVAPPGYSVREILDRLKAAAK